MKISFEATVCYISFTIGLYSIDQIKAWADTIIDRLEAPDIPEIIYDLSIAKKETDILRLLRELITYQETDIALKTVVGILNQSYRIKQITLYEVCEYFYRLSHYVDSDHEWKSYLYEIAANLESAVDGYGEVDRSKIELDHFLNKHLEYVYLFNLNLSPNEPKMTEFVPRKESIVIDVSRVFAPLDLHLVLKRQLDLPDMYGMNWNAFWDAITGMVKLPRKITISGWSVLDERFPEEAKTLRKILTDYSVRYGSENFLVKYE
ncbi:hypothetical protein BRE01_39650 [Brevibacillus reuszeri]|uniref:Barstar (barnase inhibitor) domain-containing protein n=2 Tax=Brevibacillus reuszeri TaxID=54915 RepID=A0ABQ0TTN5_9BACL|nr:barstar family protein [Brevibacillus reuszeri]MED1860595.1 barstar family protein [Brevibacillus reuszeri]GED70263.1 hypothetical protein BRE01_39650 [Brevibacillus reuszeri]